MTSAIENYVKASINKTNIEQEKINAEKRDKQIFIENAEWHCENYISNVINNAVKKGETNCSIYATHSGYYGKNICHIVNGRFTNGSYNPNSKGYYNISYFKGMVDIIAIKNYLTKEGYKVFFVEDVYKEADTRTGKYNKNLSTYEINISWEKPDEDIKVAVINLN